MNPNIYLEPYRSSHDSELNYTLSDEQHQFTALPKLWADDDSGAVRVVIRYGDTSADAKAVGFFVMDNGQDKYLYTDNDKAVLLRSMSINPDYQGKGIAKMALADDVLLPFLKRHFIDCNMMVLGVHHKNIAAQRLYEKVGFVKCPRTHMGTKGEQYIYEKGVL